MSIAEQISEFKCSYKLLFSMRLVFILLLFSWLFLPVLLWLSLVVIYANTSTEDNGNGALGLLVMFSLSMLVASRYVGFLWGGADDMPTYFMAYERYNSFSSMMVTSLLYGKHADFLFSFLSWVIAMLSEQHLFIYYFLCIFLSYMFIWKFCKVVGTPYPLLCFLLIVLFYKLFQAQWHLIRAAIAIPILLCGIWKAKENFKVGLLVFIIGALFHFSTFILLLPLFLFNNKLSNRFSFIQFSQSLIAFIVGLFLFILFVFLLSGFVDNYMINKVLTRLVIEPNFSKLPSLVFFIFVSIFSIGAYIRDGNESQRMLFNIGLYFNVIGCLAIFFIGEELHRIILPMYIIYAPLLIMSLGVFSPSSVPFMFLLTIKSFVLLSFSYVIYINESEFFYKLDSKRHPIELKGIDYLSSFKKYFSEDIEYYNGYRNK
ncbi:hypothetical protein CWC18_01350 [Pseudoalteromonas aurantia]|nr:EpsG family protein [Pseudoalteromonas aurantia]TMO67081.1 hypothetical protein CWC18_01350 [Pseudoalteromonas aurantia]